MKNKKTKIAIIGIIALILVTIGITYAYWLITRTQEGENVITTGCLDITLADGDDDITLTNQFPMSDEDGMELTPYTFTVTNNCNTSVDYQVALEAIGDENSAIKSTALKIALNDNASLLSEYDEIDVTIDEAYAAQRLFLGTLAAKGSDGASATHTLRIWIDADAPVSEMNKTFTSKISVSVGQEILNPWKEGTLAYSILSNYGGIEKTEEIDNTGYAHRAVNSTNNLYFEGNNYYGTSYTYDEATKKYTLAGTLTQATLTECRDGSKECGKYSLRSTSSTTSSATLYEIIDFVGSSDDTVTLNTIGYTNVFNSITTADEASIYKMQDDLGDSYYFRGSPTDNYVKFGEYTKDTTLTIWDADNYEEKEITIAADSPMYWRIVRINGDGTIRLIYDGVGNDGKPYANGVAHEASIAKTSFTQSDINEGEEGIKYMGYTYDNNGVETDNVIKEVIDLWYTSHLENTYGKYIADSIFCNDREITKKQYYNDNYEVTSESLAYYTDIYFGTFTRLSTNKNPKLTCTQDADKYTVGASLGNGLLSKPVGLLTADEIALAGAKESNPNTNFYLYSGERYFTISPAAWIGSVGAFTTMWYSDTDGSLNYYYSFEHDQVNARPVINLKADVQFTGNGTIDSPYEIVME